MNMFNSPDFLQIVTKVSSPSFVNEHVRAMLLIFLVLLGLSLLIFLFLFVCCIVL